MTRWSLILCALAFIGGATLSTPLSGAGPGDVAPPAELLRDNFNQAELVLEVTVLSVTEVRRYPSDRGEAGYVVYLVHTRPTRPLKGARLIPSEFDYRFTQEAGKGSAPLPQAGARLLVFLKRDSKSGSWWVIAEAAQFVMTPEVEREVAAWPPGETSAGKP